MVLSKVVAAIPFLGNGVGGRMATAPHYNTKENDRMSHEVVSVSWTENKRPFEQLNKTFLHYINCQYLHRRFRHNVQYRKNTCERKHCSSMIYDMIYLLTAIGLTPDGSSTVHIYIQTIHRTTKLTTLVGKLSGIRTQRLVKLIGKSAGCALSLRVIPWHLPYNWGKHTEKPHSGQEKTSVRVGKTSVRVDIKIDREYTDVQNY
jgi:hypothetical protein